jgi:cellulose synthase (UDP-forming)
MRFVRLSLWLLNGALFVLTLAQPVSDKAQLALSVSVIAMMVGVWILGRGKYARFFFICLGLSVIVRYLYWRLTSTLPASTDVIGLSFGLLVLSAELFCVLILAISLIINIDPLVRTALPRDADDELPSVDVFIPTYNEDEYILATTAAAAMSMDYPADKLTVWLLDDGGTDQKCNDANLVKASAARERRALGVRYLTRPRNEHAKAGNMNHALKYATGEIVVVFDADHAPFRSFLRETIGYFKRDPKLFLVQTPHVFLNPDPIERNLRTFDTMPSENEMFYSITQCGLDKWNGAFFCGSAALLRRSALDVAGGFAGVTITEDCETAFELHARGWTSIFVDKPLIAGLQPETFATFIGQRSRWCQGMFQIMILKNPAVKKGLRFIQRIAYLSSMTFWFFPFPRLIFTFSPLVYIFFDIKFFVANVNEALAYTSCYIIVNLMMQNYLYGRVRWPWISELYEYVQGVYLFKAIVSVILQPRKPTFNVTAKGLTLDSDHLSELSWPFFTIYGLLCAGSCFAFYRYAFEPGTSELMLVVGLWNMFSMIVAGVALGVVSERKVVDRHPRLAIERKGHIVIHKKTYSVDIVDVSAGGCRVTLENKDIEKDIRIGETSVSLGIKSVGSIVTDETVGGIVRHCAVVQSKLLIGIEFNAMTAAEYYVLADLMYGDPNAILKFLLKRRTGKNLFAGTGRFIWLGLTEPLRAFYYLIFSRHEVLKTIEHTDPPVPEVSGELLRMLMESASKHLNDDSEQRLQERQKVS